MAIAIAIIGGLAVGAFLMRKFDMSLLNDQGWAIFTVPDEEAFNAAVQIVGVPRWRLDTGPVKRRLYRHGLVLNLVLDENMRQWVEGKLGGIARRVEDPIFYARDAVMVLQQHGYWAEYWENPDPSAKPGTMVFVKTDALPFIVIFRRHVAIMSPKGGQRPERYK